MLNKIVIFTIFAVLLIAVKANAQLSAFTEHQVITMFQKGVESDRFPTGDIPYIGKIGLQYDFKKISYSLAYIHRSNADLWGGDEYNYNGVAIGIKYKHCLTHC